MVVRLFADDDYKNYEEKDFSQNVDISFQLYSLVQQTADQAENDRRNQAGNDDDNSLIIWKENSENIRVILEVSYEFSSKF